MSSVKKQTGRMPGRSRKTAKTKTSLVASKPGVNTVASKKKTSTKKAVKTAAKKTSTTKKVSKKKAPSKTATKQKATPKNPAKKASAKKIVRKKVAAKKKTAAKKATAKKAVKKAATKKKSASAKKTKSQTGGMTLPKQKTTRTTPRPAATATLPSRKSVASSTAEKQETKTEPAKIASHKIAPKQEKGTTLPEKAPKPVKSQEPTTPASQKQAAESSVATTHPEIAEKIISLIDALQTKDIEKAMSLYDKNHIFEEVGFQMNGVIKLSAKLFYEELFSSFPDVHIIENKITAAESIAITELAIEGTQKAVYRDIPPSNTTIQMRFANAFEFDEGGNIAKHTIYSNQLDTAIALKALPRKRSKIGQAISVVRSPSHFFSILKEKFKIMFAID